LTYQKHASGAFQNPVIPINMNPNFTAEHAAGHRVFNLCTTFSAPSAVIQNYKCLKLKPETEISKSKNCVPAYQKNNAKNPLCSD